MNEISPGIFHWSAQHEGIGRPVSSYYLEPLATVLDPQTSQEDLDWFRGRNVDRVIISNRHHYRHADRFHARYDVPVLVNETGGADLEGRPGVQTFAFGEAAGPDITAHAVDPSWPDEGALHIALGKGWLALADGAMHYRDQIHFVTDEHLGTDPERQKELLRTGYGRLLGLEFDGLLFAHGDPIAEGGKEALRAFVEAQ